MSDDPDAIHVHLYVIAGGGDWPQGTSTCMAVFVPPYGIRVYMVMGWGY
jgi:hypothetical protein